MSFIFDHASNTFTAGALLRLGLLLYGRYQDAFYALKYTDIDYYVFTDAAKYVAGGNSPYLRDTYRYTPLLAWLLIPTSWPGFWFDFGKVLFAVGDLVAAYLVLAILQDRYRMPRTSALRYASLWLLNPMVATISTRGSSEGLLAVFVVALLWATLQGYLVLAGSLLGLGIHFKIYPFIYGASIIWWLDRGYQQQGSQYKSRFERFSFGSMLDFINKARVTLVFSCVSIFLALNGSMYYVYGSAFLEHTYFYHFVRSDHRHNFSLYNILLYLNSSPASTSVNHLETLAFIPQLCLTVIFLPILLSKDDLPVCMLVQTLTFVAFNKVCTSQYFLWYMVFLPFYLPNSSLLKDVRSGIVALCLWIAGQAVWLQQAYQLEMLGISTFIPGLFSSSLIFFAVNMWLLGIIILDALLITYLFAWLLDFCQRIRCYNWALDANHDMKTGCCLSMADLAKNVGFLDPAFPLQQHLNVVASNQVQTINYTGTMLRYSSPSGLIVAAIEASKKCRLIAIAYKFDLLIRSTKGMSREYTLSEEQGQIRLAAFDHHGEELFFTTERQSTIYRFSVIRGKVVEQLSQHSERPEILVTSSSKSTKASSKYLLYVCGRPSVVLIKDLASSLDPHRLSPQDSTEIVTAAAFHPEKDDIVALGFADGTVSVHSFCQVGLKTKVGGSKKTGALQRLNEVKSSVKHDGFSWSPNRLEGVFGTRSQNCEHRKDLRMNGAVMNLAFLDCASIRLVTLCNQGQCRIVCFENGSKLIRKWDVSSTCTSLAVAAWQGAPTTETKSGVKIYETHKNEMWNAHDMTQHLERKKSSESGVKYCIAIGSSDGRLALYDSTGILMREDLISGPTGQACIKRLEWVSDSSNKSSERALKRFLKQHDSSPADGLRPYVQPSKSALATRDLHTKAQPYPPSILLDSLRRRRDIGGFHNFLRLVPGLPQQANTVSINHIPCIESLHFNYAARRSPVNHIENPLGRMSLLASPSTSLCSHPVFRPREHLTKTPRTLSKLRHVRLISSPSPSVIMDGQDDSVWKAFEITPPTDRIAKVAHVAELALGKQVCTQPTTSITSRRTARTAEDLIAKQQSQEWIPDDETLETLVPEQHGVSRTHDEFFDSPSSLLQKSRTCASPSNSSLTSSKTTFKISLDSPTDSGLDRNDSLVSRFSPTHRSRAPQRNQNFTRFPMQADAPPAENTRKSLPLPLSNQASKAGNKDIREKVLPSLPSPVSPTRSDAFTSPRTPPPVPSQIASPQRNLSISSPRPASESTEDTPMAYMAHIPHIQAGPHNVASSQHLTSSRGSRQSQHSSSSSTPHTCEYSTELEKQISVLHNEVTALREEVKKLSNSDKSWVRVGRLLVRRRDQGASFNTLSNGVVRRTMPRTNSRAVVYKTGKGSAKSMSVGGNGSGSTSGKDLLANSTSVNTTNDGGVSENSTSDAMAWGPHE